MSLRIYKTNNFAFEEPIHGPFTQPFPTKPITIEGDSVYLHCQGNGFGGFGAQNTFWGVRSVFPDPLFSARCLPVDTENHVSHCLVVPGISGALCLWILWKDFKNRCGL